MKEIDISNVDSFTRVCKIYDSENVVQIKYNLEKEEMFVEFSNSGSYIYQNITPAIFGHIISSESVGSELNVKVIKNKQVFPYRKVN